MNDSELQDILENLVDKHSLFQVIEALASVCIEKAEHIRTNWQDTNTAWIWDNNGDMLSMVAGKLIV